MKQTALAALIFLLALTMGCTDKSSRDTSAAPKPRPEGSNQLPPKVDWHRGAPAGAEPTRERDRIVPLTASWVTGAPQLQVRLWGSGSCPPVGSSASVSEDGRKLHLLLRSYPGERPCTADVRPATSVVTLHSRAVLAKRATVVDSNGREWHVDVRR